MLRQIRQNPLAAYRQYRQNLAEAEAPRQFFRNMVLFRRVYKVGDRVRIGSQTGDVLEVRLQVTHLRTIKNEEIIVPNSVIINTEVVNYSSLARKGGLILHTTVTIGYDAPWRQVHALLLTAAERTPRLLKEPKPFVLQTALNDFYVSYELNGYTDHPLEMIQIYSDLHRNIQDAFNEFGVQIMSPHFIAQPDKPVVSPKDHELLNLFMETTASNLEKLTRGLGAGDALMVMEAAHTIKGSSANLGQENIAAVAKEVEEEARRNSLEGVSEAVQCIREHCGRLAATLKVA